MAQDIRDGSHADSSWFSAMEVVTVSSPDDISSAMNSHHPGNKVNVQWTDSSGQQHTPTIGLVEGPPACSVRVC
jgi:S1-C subfamily serine protease